VRILVEVKNNYISQYHWLFEQDQVALAFTPASLDLIAEYTIKNKTGARGLHTELERVLLPHMYNLAQYRKQGISVVEIDIDQIDNPQQLRVVNE
jgi:ATP-dependent Clp protease ATP-binding subunit ClpX